MATNIQPLVLMNGNSDAIEGIFNANTSVLEIITYPLVLSILAAPPPVAALHDGDIFAIDANATGDWAGFSGYLAKASVDQSTSNVSWVAIRSMLCVSAANGTVNFWNGTAWIDITP